MVAPRDEESVQLWGADMRAIRAIRTGRSTLWALAASPDGRVIATAHFGGITLWDAATGRDLCTFEGHSFGILALAFSPDGRLLASAGQDQTVLLWNVPPIDDAPAER